MVPTGNKYIKACWELKPSWGLNPTQAEETCLAPREPVVQCHLHTWPWRRLQKRLPEGRASSPGEPWAGSSTRRRSRSQPRHFPSRIRGPPSTCPVEFQLCLDPPMLPLSDQVFTDWLPVTLVDMLEIQIQIAYPFIKRSPDPVEKHLDSMQTLSHHPGF